MPDPGAKGVCVVLKRRSLQGQRKLFVENGQIHPKVSALDVFEVERNIAAE
jgi:hypothetical protein